jgi:hypothetical protein
MKNQTEPKIADSLRKLLEDKGITENAMSDALAIADTLGMCYFAPAGKFYLRLDDGGYSCVPWSGSKSGLQASGLDPSLLKKEAVISALKSVLIKKHTVHVIMSAAGHQAGVGRLLDDTRILVPRGMRMVEPKPGDPGPILRFIRGLLGDNEVAISTLLSWMKIAVTDGLRCVKMGIREANIRTSSHMLVLVGPPSCGKTLFTSFLSEIFGNTRADPYSYLCGDTAFNGDVAESVLLVMDDVTESVLPRVRQGLATRLKQFLVNPDRRVHQKGVQALTVRTFQRVVMLANEDSLKVLPAMDRDFVDKVILLQAYPSEDVAKYRDDEERVAWVKGITASLPALISYLINDFQIPEALRDSRYGVKAYHDQRLMAELRNEDSHAELLDCLRTHYVLGVNDVKNGKLVVPNTADPACACYWWEGPARQFHALVSQLPLELGWSLEFSSSHAAGNALKRMSETMPDRVHEGTVIRGIKHWRINLGQDVGVVGDGDDVVQKMRKMADRKSRRERQASDMEESEVVDG